MSFGARFLRHPGDAPASLAGEPWGEREAILHLPGGPYHCDGLSAAQEDAVRATFPGSLLPGPGLPGSPCPGSPLPGSPFPASLPPGSLLPDSPSSDSRLAAPAARPPVRLRLLRRAAEEFLPVDVRGWEYGLDFDWSPAAVRIAGLGLMARLEWRPDLAAALWTPADGGPLFPGVFENLLRILVAYRLLDIGGVVLHSAGVVRNGAVFLFLGRSGAGKTTVARLSLAAGAEVLSDDLNALCPADGAAGGGAGCAVVKLPFTGDLGERRAVRPPVPLAALLRLEQDVADGLAPLSRAETLACLLTCAPFVNVDPHRRDRLQQVLLDLLAAGAPRAGALRFSLRGRFWSIIDSK